jgi:translation initiation factor eIF-2B subunit gamma
VQIINSVLMHSVVLEDGCHVQNSVLSSGVHLQERASLKDCYVRTHAAAAVIQH